MTRLVAEWFWRAAMVCALGWIGWELHGIHEDMMQPVDEDVALTADADDSQGCSDTVRHHAKGLNRQVEAITVATTASR